jgi:hypothetical protein
MRDNVWQEIGPVKGCYGCCGHDDVGRRKKKERKEE